MPNLFYVYGSRAIRGARSYVNPDKQLKALLTPFGDTEYIELVIRLFTFQEYVKDQYGITMTYREIDTFLLNY